VKDDPPILYPQCVKLTLEYSSRVQETEAQVVKQWIDTFRQYIGLPLSDKEVTVEFLPPRVAEETQKSAQSNVIPFPGVKGQKMKRDQV
jgi:hypothetical protein